MTDSYRVQLDVFSGPLDLLLYLVRRDEIDIQDVELGRLTEQYLEYVRLLEQIDPNTAGDFLVMAATLIELKSRALLPTPPADVLDEDDPRSVLVRQLLEYKRFKDAARRLGSAAEERARRYVRRPAELPARLEGVELEDVEVWDLLAAFGRVMSAIGQGPTRYEVTYDDTPIALYEAELLAALEAEGPTTFEALFAGRRERHEIIGLFLALLELIRKRQVQAEQDRAHDAIYLFLLVEVDEEDATPVPMRVVHDESSDPLVEVAAQTPSPAAPDASDAPAAAPSARHDGGPAIVGAATPGAPQGERETGPAEGPGVEEWHAGPQ